MKKFVVGALVVVMGMQAVLAWDVEHDEIAQLTGEFLPAEMKPFFTMDDFASLLAHCHYPDEIEWTHQYRTLEDFASHVGAEDAAVFEKYGFRNSGFLHRETARGLTMCLLARAFAKGEHARAAFYISELTHAVSDESALNHPPLLQYVQYAKYPNVELPNRKVEPGAKNVFGFRSDGYVVHRVREKLRDHQPKAPCADFMDCVVAFVADCVNQADYAARKEALIGFGDPTVAAEALADLVAMQVRTLENMIWTAWKFRSAEAPLPPTDFMQRCQAKMDVYHRAADPALQGVFAGIFDDSLNPANPRGTVGIVCDAYTGFAFNRASYVGRMLGASCGRTLRKHGYAVKGLRYFEVAAGKVPSPAEVGTILYFPGASGGKDVATALKTYRDKGGRLIVVGGRDPYDMTGFASKMERKPDGVLPVSECWENRGTVADYAKMEISFPPTMGSLAGTKARFHNPPNNGAFCKPRCDVVVLPGEDIEPLVRLDNGQGDVFTIAARRGRTVWLPQYLLMPYLFQKVQPQLDFGALTLDPFAEALLCEVFELRTKKGHPTSVVGGNAVNPDAVELAPIPLPVEFSRDMDRPVAFDAQTAVTLECADAAGVEWLNRHFADWFGKASPKVVAGTTGLALCPGDEAYAIAVDASGVKIAARTLAGVRWAAYTLRPLAIARRGTFKTEGRILPTFTASDAPMLGFRCVHLCWIPPMTGIQIERAIRLAAMMKFNYVILEPWGMYKSERNPWWCWPDAQMTKGEVRRMVAVARDLGVTMIPQINVYGHGSSARSCSMKHAILDLRPEYEPLFEPGGWNWCLTNPETQRVLRELIAELHEDFGNPPFLHLGCDEAQPPSCPECRKVPYSQLVCRHIAGLVDFVKSRNARAMIWHDMLLDRADPRWKDFVTSGSAETAKLVDILPKDVIICDWQYSYGNMKEVRTDWPTLQYFSDKGFPVATCPWMNYRTMKPMADYVARIQGFGFIETTWHHLRGSDWGNMYKNASAAAWGTGLPKGTPMFDTNFGVLLRLVGHDMKVTDPKDTGHLDYQIPPGWWLDN